ncbi:helix-turn-helix transcriptional regulator [Longibaculum muris]|uniref:helix-turn-helix transcriptional regulator n=1 Tax=Longibaculum muris TaxID=1796628 RepID=UPI002943D145|nr:helix-turn-helix transcriptional regulator [Longibaculum muris]
MRKSSVLSDDERIELEVLGRRLREIREKQGITVAELAKLAGVDRDSYSRVEKGERNASLGIIFKIAEGLEILPSDIFNKDYLELHNELNKQREIDSILTEDFCRLVNKRKVISLIKRYRKSKHISQYNLSLRMGISRNVINNLEYGRGKINAVLLKAIMSVMDMTIEQLLNEIGMS